MEITSDVAVLRIPLRTLGYMRAAGTWMPVGMVLGISWAEQRKGSSNDFYVTSWALLHYGLLENRDFGRKIPLYLEARHRQQPVEEAAHDVFGLSLLELDGVIRKYARQDSMSELTFKFRNLPAAQILASRTFDETASALRLAEIILGQQRHNKRALSMVDDVLKKHPANAHALALRSYYTDEKDVAAATAYVNRAIAAADPKDSKTALWIRNALSNIAWGPDAYTGKTPSPAVAEMRRQGLLWYERAMEADPQNLETAYNFAFLSVELGVNLPRALEILERVCPRVPRSISRKEEVCAFTMARGYSKAGQPEAARPHWEHLLQHTGVDVIRAEALKALGQQ